ncbi:MAG: VCBS repeat-containing protein [Planctomycetes bacterium]|nr:VCBS repeat-containing protein [Planctomycetota bacterium]
MRFAPRVFTFAAFASGLCAQYFVEHERSMYPGSPPSPGSAYGGSNRMVIDVDGDGHPDVLAGGSGANSTNYYRNDGRGRFTLMASGLTTATATWVVSQAMGDYDGDGLPDVCTGTSLVRNVGGGAFAVDPSIYVYALAPLPGAFIDYDGDGDLDWLANNGSLLLFANDGAGAFTDVTSTVLAGLDRQQHGFFVVDLDHDGDQDVVKNGGGLGPMTLRVWRNQGGGAFTEETLPSTGGFGFISQVQVADFDGDGSLDIHVIGMSAAGGFGAWLVTGGTGSWTVTPVDLTTPEIQDLFTAEAGDWDGDGRADWVSRTGIYLQTGPMQFVFQPLPGGNLQGNPLLIDLDGNGRLDIIAGNKIGFVRNLATGPLYTENPWVASVGLLSSPLTPRRIEARQRSASPPIDDVLVIGSYGLRLGSDAPLPGEVERTWRFGSLTGSDAAFVTPAPGGVLGLITVPWLSYFDFVNGVPVPATAPVLPVPAYRVRAGDLDGQPGDELVFSSTLRTGPMIFTRSGAGWVDVSPVVSATASTPPLHEEILLADVDGDGDDDIIHESRWLRNDGGTWTVMSSFAAYVPASATCIAAIDCDGDGDMDLFFGAAAGASRMIKNTGTGFSNDTNAWLPAGLGAVTNGIVQDIDHNGADDLLIVIGTQSHLLMNSGTTFTLVPDVGPAGALVDLDHDGRLDLFSGSRILWNRDNLLWSPAPPMLGSWTLRFDRRDVVTPVMLGMLMVSHEEAAAPWPGVGTVYVDPTACAAYTMYVIDGGCEVDLAIPASPALVGQPLRGQVLLWDWFQFHLSNVVRGVIH